MIGLVERATELHQVMTLLEGAREGAGGLLVLEGAAGIGKTTILREAAAIADQEGIAVARATGHPIEATLSFGLVRQLLEPPLARLTPEERAALAAGPARAAIALLDGAPAGRDRRARAGARGVPPGRRARGRRVGETRGWSSSTTCTGATGPR